MGTVDLDLVLDGMSEEEWLAEEVAMLKFNDVSNPEDVALRTLNALRHPETCTPFSEIRKELFNKS